MFGLKDKALAIIGGAASVVLAGALAFVWISSHFQIKSLEAERDRAQTLLDDAKADLVQCRSNRLTLQEATQRQNEAVAAANAAGDKRLEALGRVAVNAQDRARSAEKQAGRILQKQSTGDQCADADAVILGEVE